MYPLSRSNLMNTQPVNTKYGPVCGCSTISPFVLLYLCHTRFLFITSTPYDKKLPTPPTQNEYHWNTTIFNPALNKGSLL